MLQTRVPISTLNYCRIRLGQDLKSPKVIIARSPESPSSARAFPGIILACRSIGSKPPISKRTFYHVIAVDFLGIFKSCRSRTHSSMGIKRGAINWYNSCSNSIRSGEKRRAEHCPNFSKFRARPSDGNATHRAIYKYGPFRHPDF